ncbi:MAG: 3-dehydroquinate synthase [Tenuifilum sp.]|uniref:3-dehydroquinate synthase n=1 Tax=Tenuifilum TaxID=2760873 RepID=UPI001B6A2406|nr:3-dehydroquinate synthase [Bacteroidales bacterium]HOK61695.1 3-dehydroquinate synthase [Tenuifilum sp.]MBP9028822.1 3-dehydroquinate synthase [Bacteroidales bacterium]HOK85699.1 3-dehydroquinate synthase [Tenuifilum sp.]HON69847.1 3-dehydroquinate synthase [Tenuifilum sp.]
METILIEGQNGKSTIIVDERFEEVTKYLPKKKHFIITDKNIEKYYATVFPEAPFFSINPGEPSKQLGYIESIYRWLLENNADRNSFILGIGGGVVCDIAGFVASTYMRGVEFGFVSTSLLSQVDASVGGKNGVDLDGYKNIIGTFTQPRFVLCDTRLLKTLPHEELVNGFAEMVKHALISDIKLFEQLEHDCIALLNLNQPEISKHIAESIRVKASIVTADERESGIRKLLNFGHTWGHAVETLTGISHGKAVSIGMEFACRLSMEKGLISNRDYLRIINLLQSFGLPTCMNIEPSRVFKTLVKDKKRNANSIDFVLLMGIGVPKIETMALEELKKFAE